MISDLLQVTRRRGGRGGGHEPTSWGETWVSEPTIKIMKERHSERGGYKYGGPLDVWGGRIFQEELFIKLISIDGAAKSEKLLSQETFSKRDLTIMNSFGVVR
jgi:hypothetical protein